MGNQLDGTVALVTGASSGIGAATAEALAGLGAAEALAGLGAAVALAARRTERISGLADKIRAAGGTALAGPPHRAGQLAEPEMRTRGPAGQRGGCLHWAFMYAKTNPGAGRLTPRQKRVFAITAVIVVVVFGGLTAWGVVTHDSYGASGHGCVNVTVPNSTGGSTLHYCGSQARSFCLASYRSQDQVSLRARPQCVLAGLGPGNPSADPSAAASK